MITRKLQGFEGYEIKYQWQCDKHDGTGFQDIAGANEEAYTFQAAVDTLGWDWRLMVYYR